MPRALRDADASFGIAAPGRIPAGARSRRDPEAPELIRVAEPWNRETGATAARRMLEDGVSFDAVFALNDTLGLVPARLGEAGIRVPEDVAVIGFDDIDESLFSVPSMSSVDPGRDEIAEIAVELLVERIGEKGERRPPRQIKPDFGSSRANRRGPSTRSRSRRPIGVVRREDVVVVQASSLSARRRAPRTPPGRRRATTTAPGSGQHALEAAVSGRPPSACHAGCGIRSSALATRGEVSRQRTSNRSPDPA